MSLAGHLGELSHKHRVLEQKLQEAMNHPSISDEEVAKIKREKLRIKDEIQRLSHQEETQH
jgi:hypothetical protein